MTGLVARLFGEKKTEYTAEQKLAIVNQVFNGETPNYMWFDGGKLRGLSEAQVRAINEQTGVELSFGNIELHGSEYVKGTGIRVRGAAKTVASLNLGDRTAALYLVHSENPFGKMDKRVNFVEGFAAAPVDKKDYVEAQGLRYELEGKMLI
ncbi:MAG: hypothetical protein AABX04_07815 [Nanoarchaeota archaeon]